MKKKGFTLIELLVVISIIAMLLAILMPALSKVKKIASRVVCGTNLKGLGTAQTVYAHDYNDQYTVQGRGLKHTWPTTSASKTAPSTAGTFGWQNQATNVTNTDAKPMTVGASLYMLVREADVSPKSFVCPSSSEAVFTGKNAFNLGITELYDFGAIDSTNVAPEGPVKCVSYAYHMPYAAGQANAVSQAYKGRYAADSNRGSSFAVMADKNPWFDTKLSNQTSCTEQNYIDRVCPIGSGVGATWSPDFSKMRKFEIQVGNAQPHDRDGQNVLFSDGHTAYENRSDVGTKDDNIYTPWSNNAGVESERRIGTGITAPATGCAPWSSEDSVLVNDL